MTAPRDIPPVHSLLLTDPGAAIDFRGQPPAWLHLRSDEPTWLIRTRAPSTTTFWSAGLRGRTRSERHAVRINPAHVQQVITPTQLSATLPAQRPGSYAAPAMQALSEVHRILERHDPRLSWGPIGSVALELATRRGTWVHPNSDLDIVLNTEVPLEKELAKRLLTALTPLAVRIDALIEGPAGAIALEEWAIRSAPWLVRTANGPVLTATPWAVMGCESPP